MVPTGLQRPLTHSLPSPLTNPLQDDNPPIAKFNKNVCTPVDIHGFQASLCTSKYTWLTLSQSSVSSIPFRTSIQPIPGNGMIRSTAMVSTTVVPLSPLHMYPLSQSLFTLLVFWRGATRRHSTSMATRLELWPEATTFAC